MLKFYLILDLHIPLSHASKLCDKKHELMDYELFVATPLGDSLVCNYVLKSFAIQIEGREMLADLIWLDMSHVWL